MLKAKVCAIVIGSLGRESKIFVGWFEGIKITSVAEGPSVWHSTGNKKVLSI